MKPARNIRIDNQLFAQNLADLRRARGWTKQELADAAGLSERTVRLLEQGQREAVLEKTLLLLAEALAVAPEALLGTGLPGPSGAATAPDPVDPGPVASPDPAAPPGGLAGSLGDRPAQRRSHRGRIILTVLLGSTLLAGAGFGLAWRTTAEAIPLQVEVSGRTLAVSGDAVAGGAWSRTFAATIVFAESSDWHDGSILVGLGFDALDGGRVLLLDARTGFEIWQREPDPALAAAAFGPAALDGLRAFGPVCREYLDFDGDGVVELAVAFIHVRYYPANVLVIRRSGETVCDYMHRGHVYDLAGTDLDGDGAAELICAGTNNARGYAGGTVFVLDRSAGVGAAVDSLTGAGTQVADCSRRRLLVPGLEPEAMRLLGVDRLTADSIRLVRGDAGADGSERARILVRVGADGCHFDLVLASDLQPVAIRPNDNVARTLAGWPADVRARCDLTDRDLLARWRDAIVVLGATRGAT